EVVFWPNIQWANSWSTIFASDFYRSIDALKQSQTRPARAVKRTFRAKTDANGRAMLPELPPWKLPFTVPTELYELPLSEDNDHLTRISLSGGETNCLTIKLQKKGKQLRE